MNGALRLGMNGEVAQLAAFAVDGDGGNATALDKVLHAQRTEFGAAQSVVEEDGEDGAIAFAFEGGGIGGGQQRPSLVVGDGRGFALVGSFGRSLDAVGRVDGGGVAGTKVIEERADGGEFTPDGGRAELLPFEVLAPGDDVGAGHGAQFDVILDAEELDELADVLAVGEAGVAVGEVGEPLGLGGHFSELAELRLVDERSGGVEDLDSGFGHGAAGAGRGTGLSPIMYSIRPRAKRTFGRSHRELPTLPTGCRNSSWCYQWKRELP